MATYYGGFFRAILSIWYSIRYQRCKRGTLPSGFVSIQAANPNLKWESTKEINLGVDFGFLKNKIVGSFDYFARTTDNILIKPPIASAIGEGQQKWLNGATKESHGRDFRWDTRTRQKVVLPIRFQQTLAHLKDKITKLPRKLWQVTKAPSRQYHLRSFSV